MNLRACWLALAWLVWLAGPSAASAQAATDLFSSGSPANRIDVVVVGDGYTAAEQAKFLGDAATFMDGFLADPELFADYRSYFNVHALFVASAESGATHLESSPALVRNTALGAYYGCNGIDRLICVNLGKVNTAVNAVFPAVQRDYVFVLVNDTVYGGSGGTVLVSSINVQAREIMLHEFGHTHGLLADEYTTTPPPCSLVEPGAANATMVSTRASIKWNHWIDPATPVPTTSTQASIPGLYEGAWYCATGMFRPTFNSKMRSLNAPFDAVNREQLVRRFYNFVSTIDADAPAAGNISAVRGSKPQFTVTPLAPVQHSLVVAWTVDSAAAGNGNALTLDTGNLTVGTHNVTATVHDPTAQVRSDPGNLLTDSATWVVTVAAAVLPAASLSVQVSPAAVNAGQPVTLTVTAGAAGGSPPPGGTVSFAEGATSLGSAPLNAAGVATFTTPSLAAGTHAITVGYSGDAVYSSASTSATVVVLGATSVVLATPVQAQVGQAVALVATVGGVAGLPVPAGSVTFRDGGTVIGTAALEAGRATFSAAGLAAGSHSLTAAYAGNAAHQPSVSAAQVVTLVSPDFTLSGAAQGLTVRAGSAAQLVLSLSGNGSLPQTATFTCSGLPPSATCGFTPDTATLGSGAAAVTMTIAVPALADATPGSRGLGMTPLYAVLIVPFVVLRRRRPWRAARCLAPAALCVLALVACGGGGDGGPPATTAAAPSDPSAAVLSTSTVTVTATTTGTMPTAHSIDVTVTITR